MCLLDKLRYSLEVKSRKKLRMLSFKNIVGQEEYLFKNTLMVSILFSPFILNGRSVIDEILISILAFSTLILTFMHKKNILNQISNFSKINIELLLLTYLLFNCLSSLILNYRSSSLRGYNEYNLRYILIFASAILLVVLFNTIKQNFTNIKEHIVIMLTLSNLVYVQYWLILKLLGFEWEDLQAIAYVGSTYAALVPGFGLLICLILYKKSHKSFYAQILYFNLLLTFLASYLYYSRLLYFFVVLTIVFLIVDKFLSIRSLFLITLLSTSIFTQNIYSVGVSSNYTPTTSNIYDLFSFDKALNIGKSIKFAYDPRISDSDRFSNISCSNRLLFESNAKNFIFGYGNGMHRSILYMCNGKDPLSPGAPVRPVSYASFLIDFGFLGLILYCALIIKLILRTRENSIRLFVLIILVLLCGSSLLVNFFDHSFIYFLLFYGFYDILSGDKSKSGN
jgi:hypothetical protein